MTGRSNEEPPPLFRSWGALYLAVLGALFLMVVFLYGITELFSGGLP